jgi:amino-acid N-acetyltransferase
MIRKATIKDIKEIHRLLKYYGDKGLLLSRPLSGLYDHLRDFKVYVDDNDNSKIIGCCALQFCWEDLAEIRSLAVHPDHIKKSIGSKLVKTSLLDAKTFHIKKVFTLTYKPEFFQKFDFLKIDRSELPLKIWTDCITCVKFPDCDETALMKEFV